jgi:hypothetical protein
MRSKLKREYYSLVQFVNVVITFLVICFLFTLFFRITEQVSWDEAFWQTWQTATTVGYGNRPAETFLGRIVTILFGTIAIAYLPVLIGIVFDYISNLREKRRYGFMPNSSKKGYVIFNFPGVAKLKTFIEEIRAKESDVSFCVVDSEIEEIPKDILLLGKIDFVKGELLDKATYEQAKVKDCSTIVIFPIRSGDSSSDSMTQTIVQLCLQFIDTTVTRLVHILVNPNHNWLFEGLQSTQVIENMSLLATVQECQDPFSAEIVEQIISNTNGANPHTFDLKKFEGLTWGVFQKKVQETSTQENMKINVLALIQNSVTDTCPFPNTIINKSDKVSILVFNDFSWDNFQKKMK